MAYIYWQLQGGTLQKFTVAGDKVQLNIKASRGVVLLQIVGQVEWCELQELRLQAIELLEEQPVAWIHDYTNANICKFGETTSEALKRHQIYGAIRAANAIVARAEDVEHWRLHLRKVRSLGIGARGIFGPLERRDAYLWAALQARHKRRLNEAISSIPGML